MKVLQGNGEITLAIVCCQHGNEVFGKRVFDYYQDKLPGIRLIMANEEAFDQGKRFIDDDLNRSFPGDNEGSHEEQLAAQILPHIKDVQYVLDIHTTTSNILMTPIICNETEEVKKILNLTSSREVAYMGNGIADHSLIGQVAAGVSLEFNENYAKTGAALDEVKTIIDGLLNDVEHESKERRIFDIEGSIAADQELEAKSANFRKDNLLGGYPFLLHEKSYKPKQGFYAKSYRVANL